MTFTFKPNGFIRFKPATGCDSKWHLMPCPAP